MLSTLKGPAYIERASLHDKRISRRRRKPVKKALKVQMAGKGFSLVELLSTCPTNWGLDPLESLDRVKNEMMEYYPLGVFAGKDLEV